METFLQPLPVGRIPGVGKVTEGRPKDIGVATVGDLAAWTLPELESRFGRYGLRLYELARGVDQAPVVADRPIKSISAEDTFPQDLPLSAIDDHIRRLAAKVWAASRTETRVSRTVVLKLKTAGFASLTRSFTPPAPPASCEDLVAIALSLRSRIALPTEQLYRLVGVGLSNFNGLAGPPQLFGSDQAMEPQDLARNVAIGP